ncbi:MAG: hypothetical protein H6855_06770 [Rhodospirillales bacterium]|nr:hypothetical protein [Rhodospirillales bacterium]
MSRGVRLNPKHDEKTRLKIKTSQIINQLIKHVKGEVEMANSQVRAAEILLRKTLPDLKTIEHVQENDNKPIVIQRVVIDDIPRN